VQQLGLVLLRRLVAELVEDLAHEVHRGPAGIRQQADLVALGLQPLDQRARQRGLAAAVLADEHAAALAVAHGVDEADQRFLVLGRQVKEFRIRRVVEGGFTELPVRLVHR
jgi:hypothetical protein